MPIAINTDKHETFPLGPTLPSQPFHIFIFFIFSDKALRPRLPVCQILASLALGAAGPFIGSLRDRLRLDIAPLLFLRLPCHEKRTREGQEINDLHLFVPIPYRMIHRCSGSIYLVGVDMPGQACARARLSKSRSWNFVL